MSVLQYLDACMEGHSGRETARVEDGAVRLIRRGAGMLTGAIGRWAGLGPYYAMFPMRFAVATVRYYSPAGGAVLDPFAGRGTSIYAAAATGRRGLGIEVHPAGWIYGETKLRPANLRSVLDRLAQIGAISESVPDTRLQRLSEFFHWCFCKEVLRFLLAARRELDWRSTRADRTLMAFILNYLHNSDDRGLSNQMHQAKSMAPDYSVEWWKSRGMTPIKKDPVFFLGPRIAWRYRHGAGVFKGVRIQHADAMRALPQLARTHARFDLLFTSPPYYNVANYHSDQWLRLWMLGGPCRPKKRSHISKGSFDNYSRYQQLLCSVFERAAPLLRRGAAVYVRTDAREQTLLATSDALKHAFPRKRIRIVEQPFEAETQTALFGDRKKKPGEVDLVISAVR